MVVPVFTVILTLAVRFHLALKSLLIVTSIAVIISSFIFFLSHF